MRKERITRKIANIVPDTLRSLWESAESLMVESEEVKVSVQEPYPSLDWTKVNSRFINNIPKPVQYPTYGCSLDPVIYEWTHKFHYPEVWGGTKENIKPKFETSSTPFGSQWGYRTSEGIISVSNVTHHGYIWNDGHWILHAEQPSSKEKVTKGDSKFIFKKKFKEKKEAT